MSYDNFMLAPLLHYIPSSVHRRPVLVHGTELIIDFSSDQIASAG
jgi:hypothetical protein